MNDRRKIEVTGYIAVTVVLSFIVACGETRTPNKSSRKGEIVAVQASDLQRAVGTRVQIAGIASGTKGAWYLAVENHKIFFDRAIDSKLVGLDVLVVGKLEIEHVAIMDPLSTDDIVQSETVSAAVDRYVFRDFEIVPR
ncbi:MAG: hypothetical protein ACK5Q4_10320 [Phycisphaerae bacterium]|jgi:hypothetical protein